MKNSEDKNATIARVFMVVAIFEIIFGANGKKTAISMKTKIPGNSLHQLYFSFLNSFYFLLNLCKFCKKTINKLTKIINIQMPADKLPNIVNAVNPSPR